MTSHLMQKKLRQSRFEHLHALTCGGMLHFWTEQILLVKKYCWRQVKWHFGQSLTLSGTAGGSSRINEFCAGYNSAFGDNVVDV
jgi:hypothetical protein